jgi:hypothetical protein
MRNARRPVSDPLHLYWSHCGTYRLHHAEKMGLPPIRTLDDIRKLGEHVRERGFTALKTNIFLFDGGSSMKIAATAEAYEVNCAPHNFYGHMSTLMSAHFCAAIPNFRIMEIDIDDVPWKDDLRHRAAAHRERPPDHAHEAWLGRRRQRGCGEEASAEVISLG